MSSALINHRTSAVRQLDKPAQPDEVVKPQDVEDPGILARILRRVLVDIASLKRRFERRSITFIEVVSTGATASPMRLTLVHGLGALVHWYVVRSTNVTVVDVLLINEVANDGKQLVLNVHYPAILAIRVEERG